MLLLALPRPATAAPWQLDPNRALPGDDGGVSQKVELADIDADGFVDLVFATSRGDSVGGEGDAQLNRLIRNDPQLGFVNVPGVFEEPDNAYVIKAGDVDRDDDLDLVVGGNFGDPSYLLLNNDGAFVRQDLPGELFHVGDLELGDLDGDGGLDILAADWGVVQPYGAVGDPGGPLRLLLGVGPGEFSDGAALLPPAMDTLLSWSFDLELLDFDNDFDLDILAASRGPGPALALRNDDGVFVVHPIPALAGKPVNSAFTVLDLDHDDDLDLVTLQDGFGGGRNTVLAGGANGGFVDNPGAYWALVDNPQRLDFDAASLDFHGDGTPDVVVVGLSQNPGQVHARLMLNDGSSLVPIAPDGAAWAVGPELSASFGVQIADLDHDRRPDLAVAVRDPDAPDAVLFAGPDVPEDSSPPRIGVHEQLPPFVVPGEKLALRARVDDGRTPAPWHDFQHDPQLPSYQLVTSNGLTHLRRLPYLEFVYDLDDPALLDVLPDTGPEKWIVPGVWYGEALWWITFFMPLEADAHETIHWRLCAIDAAGNKSCGTTHQANIEHLAQCGNGVLDPGEACDDAIDMLCVDCQLTCGDGMCMQPETGDNCPSDCAACDGDLVCEPGEDANCCDCTNCGLCGDGTCDLGDEDAMNCPEDCSACGDGVCDVSETPASCTDDCGFCGDDVCAVNESSFDCPEDCHICGDCICNGPENPDNCPEDCVFCEPTEGGCGDGFCAPGEDGSSCPIDCPEFVCGDGVCDALETAAICPEDCGFCGDRFCDPSEDSVSCCEDCGDQVCGEDDGTSGSATVDDGLGCSCRGAPGGGLAFGLMALLARRRRRHAR